MNNQKSNGAVTVSVGWAVSGAVGWAVGEAVYGAVSGAVYRDVWKVVEQSAVRSAAVRWAMNEEPRHPGLQDFLNGNEATI